MAERKALARIPLGRSLDQGADQRLITPGSMGEAHNVVVDRAGRYTKRRGWPQLPQLGGGGTELDPPERVDAPNGELLQVERGNVWSWSPGTAKWQLLGHLPPWRIEHRHLLRQATNYSSIGLCRFGTDGVYELVVWQHTLGLEVDFPCRAQIRDSATGAIIGRDATVFEGLLATPLTMTVGASAWVLYSDGATKVDRFAGNLLSFPTYTLFNDSLLGDACPVQNGTRAFVAGVKILASTEIRVGLFTETGTLDTDSTITAIATPVDIRICQAGSGYRLLVKTGASDERTLTLYTLDSDLTLIDAITIESDVGLMEEIEVAYRAGDTWIVWHGKLTDESIYDLPALHVRCVVGTNGEPEGWRKQLFRARTFARALSTSDGLFLPVCATNVEPGASMTSLTAPHLAMVQLDDELTLRPPRYAGVLVRQLVAWIGDTAQHWARTFDGQGYQLAVPVLTRLQPTGRNVQGVDRIEVRAARSAMPAVDLPQQYVWGGAGLWGSDHAEVHDVNILQAPRIFQNILDPYEADTNPSGAFPGGAYLYRARLECIDNDGVEHVSPWSDDYVFDCPQDAETQVHAVKLKVALTQLTQHGRGGPFRTVSVALYRSAVNGVVDGVGTLYRLTGYGSSALSKQTGEPTLDYLDDDVDASAKGLGTILTSGGLLEARVLPPVRAICRHQGRLFAASVEPERAIWFSQSLQTDESPRWHERLRVQLTDSGDPVVALASLDANLIAWTRSSIHSFTGEGPTDTGADGAFAGPFPVATAFGCTDPGSVVVTSRGAYFRSTAGLCLLDRSLTVQVIGDPVRDLLDLPGAEILGATYHEADARVIWHLSYEGDGTVSMLLIYDERHAVWTTADSLDAGTITHLTYDRGARALVLAGPFAVHREGYGLAPGYDGAGDDPTWISATIASPWLRAGDVGSWSDLAMFHLEGELGAESTTTIEIARDYDLVEVQTLDIVHTGTRGARIVRQIGPEQRTAAAFRVALREKAPTVLPEDLSAPQGVIWWGMSAEVSVVGGLARIDSSYRGGASLWPNGARLLVVASEPWQAACSVARWARASAWGWARRWAVASKARSTSPTPLTRTRSIRRSTTRARLTRSAPTRRRRPRPLRIAGGRPQTGRWPTPTASLPSTRAPGR